MVGAATHGLHRALDGGGCAEDDYWRLRLRVFDPREQIETIIPVHPERSYDDVGGLLEEPFERSFAIVRDLNVEARVTKIVSDRVRKLRDVIDDKHPPLIHR